ncbi:MAG: hypothetical protein ABI583_13730 [Betaproteobacteria bacterium]
MNSDRVARLLERCAETRTRTLGRYNTLATTLTEIAMTITLKKNDTTLCNVTNRRNDKDVIATSDI